MTILNSLRSAESGSRELDAEIDVLLFGGETVWKLTQYTMEPTPSSKRASSCHIGGYAFEHVPHYTTSIDAALTLVGRMLPGVMYDLHKCETGWSFSILRSNNDRPYFGGLSAPIAILAALFTALEAKENAK